MAVIWRGILTFLAVMAVGCAQGHCRHSAPQPEAKPLETLPDPSGAQKLDSKDTVFIYKYDGSLQCKKGTGTSVDVTSRELLGIQILSMTKKKDGLMHITVCGSSTGMANVYEIPSTDLKQAEGKGFKQWSFE